MSVSLGVLNKTFREGAIILISRKFAETNGIQGERVTTSTGSKEGREEMESHAPIEITTDEF